jgi:hypothetical protein
MNKEQIKKLIDKIKSKETQHSIPGLVLIEDVIEIIKELEE